MKKTILACTILMLFLVGCGCDDSDNAPKEGKSVILTLATFEGNTELNQQVAVFNEKYDDYKIEIQNYNRFEQEDGDGIKRLQREIVSGNGPDIINYGSLYSVTDILGRYTEDLFPYFEKISTEIGESYFYNILQAFSYQNGLYAMPVSFTLKTYVGRTSVIGERESWKIEELMTCYQEEKEKSGGTLILYPGETKKDVFGSILTGSVHNYVDWSAGTCVFDGEEFKKVMNFANQFPGHLSLTDDFSPIQCFASGKALLFPMSLSSIYDVSIAEMVMGEKVTYIGYPVNGLDGTVIKASDLMLAISSESKYKDVAWEFISQFLGEDYQSNILSGFPINKKALDTQLQSGLNVEYTEDVDGNKCPVVKAQIVFEGEDAIDIYQITEEQRDVLIQIIDKASIGSAYDSRLHTILLEEIEGYFNGDKTLDETAEIMQNRAQIYVSEESS